MSNLEGNPPVQDAVSASVVELFAEDDNAGQKWLARRNIIIYMAHCHGLSHRVIADALKISPHTVRGVVKKASDGDSSSKDQAAPYNPTAYLMEVPPDATRPMIRRARRELVIRLVHSKGVSQRKIADAFGLPRSVVGKVLKQKGGERMLSCSSSSADTEGSEAAT